MTTNHLPTLADQLKWCNETSKNLTNLADAIHVMHENVRLTLIALHQQAPAEVAEAVKKEYIALSDQVNETIKHIHTHHIEYVSAKADDVRKVLVEIQNLGK